MNTMPLLKRLRSSTIFIVLLMNFAIIIPHYIWMVKDVGTYDTAKFQFIGYTLGVPHTSGYPLHTLLSWLFTNILVIGEIAWRQNLLNLLFSIISLNFLFFIFRQLSLSLFFSFLLVLLQAFSLTFWYVSYQSEVYSLHIMLISIVTFLIVRHYNTGIDNYYFFALCIFGLMFSNHLTSICLFPGLLIYILLRKWRLILNYKIYLYSALGILFGMLPYLYIYSRFFAPNDVYVEMHVYDFNSFFNEITGGKFQGQLNTINWEKLRTFQLPMTYKFFKSGEISFLALFFIFAYIKRNLGPLLIFLTISVAFNIYFAISFDVYDPWGYYTPVYFLLLILVGIGIENLKQWVQKINPSYAKAFILIISILLSYRLATIFKYNSKKIHQFTEKEDYHRAIAKKYLEALNGECIFIITSDQTWQTLHYFLQIKEKDKKITLIPIWYEREEFFQVHEYLKGKDYFDVNFRKSIKPGLPVYLADKKWIPNFEKFGFKAIPQENGMYRLATN